MESRARRPASFTFTAHSAVKVKLALGAATRYEPVAGKEAGMKAYLVRRMPMTPPGAGS
jgi:hypothetical protein